MAPRVIVVGNRGITCLDQSTTCSESICALPIRSVAIVRSPRPKYPEISVRETPTVIVDAYQHAGACEPGPNSYKGLAVHALPGLHEFVAEKALEFFVPGATVLDIGAGSGAMCQRMLDLGFRVAATDYRRDGFKLESVPFIQADLNQGFAALHADRFQCVIACEII